MNARIFVPVGLLAALIALAVILSTPHPGRGAFSGSNGYILLYIDAMATRKISASMPDGSDELLLTRDGRNFPGSWSADDTRIAFVSNGDGGSGDIYIKNSDGSNETRLNNNSLQDSP